MACTKVRFATEKDALFYIDKLNKTSIRDKVPIATYLCHHCNLWHLTSRNSKENQEIFKLRQEIDVLITKIETLVKEAELLKRHNDKDENIVVKKEKRLNDYKERIKQLNKVISKLRYDNSTYISKVISLERQLENNKS
jgi:chromosome segregation ATPase